MTIGIDGSKAFSSQPTGTENYSSQIIKNISLIDHTTLYYIFIHPKVDPHKYFSWPKNFNFITIPFPRLWTQVGLALETFKHPILDVLFVPSHTLPIFRKTQLKTVVTVHDLGAQYLPKTHQFKQRVYLDFMTKYQLKSASHIISVSKSTKQDLIQKVRIPPEKITVVYEGYDDQLFKPKTKDDLKTTLASLGLQPQAYFLFVGTIQPRKNLARLISAYAAYIKSLLQNNNYPKLVLSGSKGWLANDLYTLPQKLGITDQVKFTGYTPVSQLPALYSGARALLFPSLFEGFGLPILEAMACGCPVLTSNSSSLPEVAGDAAILVDPHSEQAIFNGIKMIANGQLRLKLQQAGFKQVKNFSWKKAAQETIKVLETISG